MSDKIQGSDVAAFCEGWRKAIQKAAEEYEGRYDRSYQETITDYLQANKETLKANLSAAYECEVIDVYYDAEQDVVMAKAVCNIPTHVIDLTIQSADFGGNNKK